MEFDDIKLQFIRLDRHNHVSLNYRDPISFLDLSHSLRIWVDMKSYIDTLLRDKFPDIRFKNSLIPKAIDKILKGSKYTFLPLASGVDSPGIEVKSIHIIERALSAEEVKKMYEAGPPSLQNTDLNFSQWLGSGIYKVPNKDEKGLEISISREIIIKRVANLLGASHPKGTDSGQPKENRFDPYIINLHQIILANGYPATYYQLLEIAKDILNTLKPIFVE